MSLLNVLGGVASAAFPAAAPVIALINRFRPQGGKSLPPTATNAEVENAYRDLPAHVQREVDLAAEKLAHENLKVMASVESAAENTRPRIALLMARVIALGVTGAVAAMLWAVITGDSDMAESVNAGWPMLATTLGIPAGVVTSYFGRLNQDKATARGAPERPGLVATMLGALRK